MAEVEPDARKASFEVETEAVERSGQLSPAPLEHLQRLGPPAQAIQHVGNAVEAVVETEPRRPAWMQCPLDEPVLVRRIPAATHRVEAVEHPGRPVRHVEAAGVAGQFQALLLGDVRDLPRVFRIRVLLVMAVGGPQVDGVEAGLHDVLGHLAEAGVALERMAPAIEAAALRQFPAADSSSVDGAGEGSAGGTSPAIQRMASSRNSPGTPKRSAMAAASSEALEDPRARR